VNAPPPSGRPRFWRKKYLIDKPTQLRISGWLLGGLLGIAIMYVLAMLVFLSPAALEGMESDAVRRLLLTANLAYFLFAGILIVTLAVLLSHRFVGPAFVFKNALEAMGRGDYTKRLSLRRTDYMQDVAAGLVAVRTAWLERDRKVVEAAEQLERCLERHDMDGVHAAVAALKKGTLVVQAPAPAPAPAASEPATRHATAVAS
jgi:hypothetical protein